MSIVRGCAISGFPKQTTAQPHRVGGEEIGEGTMNRPKEEAKDNAANRIGGIFEEVFKNRYGFEPDGILGSRATEEGVVAEIGSGIEIDPGDAGRGTWSWLTPSIVFSWAEAVRLSDRQIKDRFLGAFAALDSVLEQCLKDNSAEPTADFLAEGLLGHLSAMNSGNFDALFEAISEEQAERAKVLSTA